MTDLVDELSDKIKHAEELNLLCKQQMLAVNGFLKLQRKIEAELRFLRKLETLHSVKEDHLRSSNLYHLAAVINCYMEMKNVVHVLAPFTYEAANSHMDELYLPQKRLIVDIVADSGKTWIKVIAGNPHALLLSSLGEGKFGRKNVIQQVEELLECAKQNLHVFEIPKLKIYCAAGITEELKLQFESMNVEVCVPAVKHTICVQCCCSSTSSKNAVNSNSDKLKICKNKICDSSKLTELVKGNSNVIEESEICNYISEDKRNFTNFYSVSIGLCLDSITNDSVLNLDISTMIAHVSNLTNGFCYKNFHEKILSDQASRERTYSVKCVFDQLFKDRKLICCEAARTDFLKILNTVAGENEKKRATELLAQVTVVPDTPSERAVLLQNSGKIKRRSKIIFGTGDSLEAVTVTANVGFLRSAISQGIRFVAFVHESRALTELKEVH